MFFIPSVYAATAEHAGQASEHAGPHIPALQGEGIHGLFIPGTDIAVTSTILSTWIFMLVFFVGIFVFYRAIQPGYSEKSKVRAVGLDLMRRLDVFFAETLGHHQVSRKFLWLVGGIFIFIFTSNLFGLILDVIDLIIPAGHAYLRPINSDLNTTLVLSTTIILVAQATSVVTKGFLNHCKHYLVNYSGHSTAEKCVNVLIGWLHLLGEFIRVGSLSLRLFLNIFVGAILIGVAVYIGSVMPGYGVGKILSLPLWFFELLVAFLQAYVFMMLSGLYLKEALHKDHH